MHVKIDHLKTIYGVKKLNASMIKRIVDTEAEGFLFINPDYSLFNIKAESSGGDSVTYKMVFIHKNFKPM